ncbi:MAG TPA: hypothetical protein VKN18_14525, partial [Blastocatellia bacterium]|nr:hypothetical protein [Blastocatellia bacterium]
MNRGLKFPLRRTLALVTATAMMVMLTTTTHAADPSQKKDKGKAAPPPSKINEAYAAKIKEYTTEKYFLTEFVDHLPASDKVPSPDKVLGYVIGTPNKLTYTKDMYRYYRELEKGTPRVRVFTAPERSEEGREQLLVVVSDEANLVKLERYKEITAKLADPRKINDAEAQQL